jgi:hypothetical protein
MSDEDIIRIANQAGWDVQNLDDGFGERLRRFAQDLERQPLYTTPPKRDLTCVCGAVWEGETMAHPPRKAAEWFDCTDAQLMDEVRRRGFVIRDAQIDPVKHEWVGLTDEDIHDAFNFTEVVKQLSWDREPVRWCENFSAYIEAKLKEKNT